MAEVGGAARHGQVQVGAIQQARRLRAFAGQPAVDDFQDALLDLRRLEHAAVEQDGRGMQEGRALGLRALEAFDLLGGAGLA